MQRRDFCRNLWRKSNGVTGGYKGEGYFRLGIDIQQMIHVGVDEAAYDRGRQTQGSGDGEKVGEHSPVVPAEVAVGARLILPGIAPVSACANDSEWCVCDSTFSACGFKQDTPIISRAQAAQTEFGGSEVVDTRRQVAQVAANQIKLHLVERSGAGCRAKVEFMPGIAPLSGNEFYFRAAACTGALYEVELYLICCDLSNL